MVSDTHYALKEYKTSNNYIWEINKEQILSSGGEIIGQPLRLADLLMAIEEKKKFNSSWEPYRNAITKLLMPYYDQGKYQNDRFYNLSKDNILDQSDDLCSFCLELLK